MTTTELLRLYPEAGAIYDTGSHYAIVQGDLTILADHGTGKMERMLPTYSDELAKICRGAIPVWPADLDDDD